MNAEAGNALIESTRRAAGGHHLDLHRRPRHRSSAHHLLAVSAHPLQSVPPDELAAPAEKEHGMEEERARTLANWRTAASPEALRLSEAGWQAHRDWMLRASGLDQPQLFKTRSGHGLPDLCRAPGPAQRDASKAIWNSQGLDTGSKRLAVCTEACDPPGPERDAPRDRAGIGERQLTALWEVVELAQKAIAANSNLRLTLDVMALRMSEALSA